MIKKFEIKSHDGPGRIGKIDDELSPKLFFKDEIKIDPTQGSAHNIDREIAEFNVKETLSSINKKRNCYGLLGIYERVKSLGGRIEIKSSMGEGTTYKIKLPVNRKVKKDNYEKY